MQWLHRMAIAGESLCSAHARRLNTFVERIKYLTLSYLTTLLDSVCGNTRCLPAKTNSKRGPKTGTGHVEIPSHTHVIEHDDRRTQPEHRYI